MGRSCLPWVCIAAQTLPAPGLPGRDAPCTQKASVLLSPFTSAQVALEQPRVGSAAWWQNSDCGTQYCDVLWVPTGNSQLLQFWASHDPFCLCSSGRDRCCWSLSSSWDGEIKMYKAREMGRRENSSCCGCSLFSREERQDVEHSTRSERLEFCSGNPRGFSGALT